MESDLATLPNGMQKDIPISTLLEYSAKGLSGREIAKLVGCSKTNVNSRLQQYKNEIESLNSHKNSRADVLAVVSSHILNSLSPGDIKKMSGLQKTTAYCQLYDKERLERDKATSITSYPEDVRKLSDILQELKSRGIDPDVIDVTPEP